ncbi:MAG: enoyl-CoA hydratase/isomerase family protein [Gemmatimonadetes bacterium]|nr:enoyl-CoA hydratase/isomerase family protein [Gemmatimonadota bacterium]
MTYETLRVEHDGSRARVTLARPDVRNAFNAAMIAELTACFGELADREEMRAIVLAGEGASFCAGADVNWMRASVDASEDENRADAQRMATMFRAVDECPVPVVGRVQGVAFGGGVGLVSCCDVVIAAEDASFCFSEVRLGILPAVISTFALAKIGRGQARRWFLTAEVLSAARAREIGLVHEVVPPDRLDAGVEGILHAVCSNGPQAVREAKALIRRVAELERGAAIEHCAETIARVRVSREGQEGLRAFLDKRLPVWRRRGGSAGTLPTAGGEPTGERKA